MGPCLARVYLTGDSSGDFLVAHQPLSWFEAAEAPATVGSLPLCTIEWRKLVPGGRAASGGLGAVPGAARGFDRSTWLYGGQEAVGSCFEVTVRFRGREGTAGLL